ncbi:MAG: rhodanese-like domain-containing protein [Candidatus Cloacimonetes bacterium]|jgi:rhodanese-related sulfurtransferase|nr:rhodanese-like domain-containing protein [Candidatus Cloacimonadota bacterium]MBT4332958.1 rhodanese-like domain-containing protein [Candidatus Cloacimonadota bacterium]MBT5420884.1 rhodanese-like domain-containing protein [Candidatus Cloacimonadota bacterium]
MKKWMKFVLVIAVMSVIFVAGCKDDTTDPDVSAFETVTNYMDDNGMTVTELFDGWITTASAVVDTVTYTVPDYYVMDIRSQAHYDTLGHIEGAVHSSLGTIVTDAALADKPIIVVCYSGQSAGHAVMALRLSGYSDAKSLKWGMSGWNSVFDVWSGNTNQLNHANWEAAPGLVADAEIFDYPEIDSDTEDGAGILLERVAAMLEGGFKGITALDGDTTVGALDNPADFFINNYWAAEDVATYGNIQTAYRINPLVLENLDAASTIVTYCWTGQTSSMVTAYLNVLGYDAKSLKFGVNGIIYDDLLGHKWAASMDYDYVVTTP